MSLEFATQIPLTIIGTKNGTTRTPVTLTNAYGVADKTKELSVGGFIKANLDILYTMATAETGNSVDIKIETSPDGNNWYRIPNESVTSGTSTLNAREFIFVGLDGTSATISIGLDIFYKYIRVSVKETGVITNFGTVFVECTLSGK